MAAWGSDQLAWPFGLLVPANAIGAWLAVAFVAGATSRALLPGAAAGLVAVLVADAVYYVLIAQLGSGIRVIGAPHAAVVWGAVGVVAGPVMGAAGAAWRGRRGWPRSIAVGLLGGALIAEGLVFGGSRLVAWVGPAPDWGGLLFGVEVAIGLLLPAVLLGRGERRRGYAALAVASAGALLVIGPAVDLVRDVADRF